MIIGVACSHLPAAQNQATIVELAAPVAPTATAAPPSAIDEKQLVSAKNEFLRRVTEQYPGLVTSELAIETGTHQTAVNDVDANDAETFAVSVSSDRTARVWALDSGQPLATLRFPREDGRGKLYAVSISPRGTQVAVGGNGGNVVLYDSSTWQFSRQIELNQRAVHQLRFSPDGKRLAVGLHRPHGFVVYQTAGGAPVFEADDIDGDVYGLAFDAKGRLAVAAWDGTVRLYSDTYRLLAKREFKERPYRIALDQSNEHLVVGFVDRPVVRELALPTLRTERELQPKNAQGCSLATVASGSEVFASGTCQVDGENPILRFASDSKRLPHWFLHRNTPERLLALKSGQLLLGSQDPLVALFDETGEVLWSHGSTAPTFGASYAAAFAASETGAIAAFNWGGEDPARIVFDLDQLATLDSSRPPPLLHAVTESPRVRVEHWLNATDPSVDGRRLDTERFETCRALSIAESGHFLLGCEWGVYLFDAQGNRIWRHNPAGPTRGAFLTADGRVAVVAFNNGTLGWLDGATGSVLVTVAFSGENHDWVAWTPEAFYSGTPHGEQLLGLSLLQRDASVAYLPLERFAGLMRRPDVLKQALRKAHAPGEASARP